MLDVAFDASGQPLLVLQEDTPQKRTKGLEAHKANLLAARAVADSLRSSLGPRGMDKIIVDADGSITVTNDGAVMLAKMEVEHQCAKLLVDLAQSQDEEIGDGTTGVVIIAGGLLEQAAKLLDKGLHPLAIADGFDRAADVASKCIDQCGIKRELTREDYITTTMTALSSKVVAAQARHLATIAVDAVLSVADLERKDVNFDLIKVQCRPGGCIEESALIHGIVIDKDLSHSQMAKETTDAKIAVLTCAFEPPKPKTKHRIDIQTPEAFEELQQLEAHYFKDMIKRLKDCGATFVICQWGFDDEANHLLMANDLPAVRWVGGVDLELIAIATGAQIVPRFEMLSPEKLGKASRIHETTVGTDKSPMVAIEECGSCKAVTIVLRGGNSMLVAEIERSMADALRVVRNLIRDPTVVPGGGATEMAIAIAVEKAAENTPKVDVYIFQAFANGVGLIPEALAENCGLDAIEAAAKIKAMQHETKSSAYGVGLVDTAPVDMVKSQVFESKNAKKHQIALATQAVRLVLKIDDMFTPDNYD